jgi:hypothetical protein
VSGISGPLRKKWLTPAVCLLVLWSAVAQACNVPVFRFALERWRPDPYRIIVFHRGPLAANEVALVGSLEEKQESAQANFIFRTVDLDALEGTVDDRAAAQALFATQNDPPLPWLTVQYPVDTGIQLPIIAGPLNDETIGGLFGSPARTELFRRLGSGQTAVWLLLESGDAERDKAAETVIVDELKRLEVELKLPELTDSPDDMVLKGVPLKLAFSVLRVSRNDESEQSLVKMLIHSESDLPERDDPMVFPVFGRGRALFALIGPGITAENVRGSAAFLTGACSCEIKELNPGFDLLLATDWDGLFDRSSAQPSIFATREQNLPAKGELVPIPPGSNLTPAASAPSDTMKERTADRPLLVAGIAAVAAALVILLFKARRRLVL